MSKYIDADKLIAEIKRRMESHRKASADGYIIDPNRLDEDEDILSFITSLQQEQPSLPSNLDEAAIIYINTPRIKSDKDKVFNEVTCNHEYMAFKAGAEYGFDKGYKSGKKDTIEKALKWLLERMDVSTPIPTNEVGEPLAAGYANYLKERQNVINQVESEFRKAMEE